MYNFTGKEIRDLTIAFIVLSIAFAISTVGLYIHGFVSILPIIMIGVGIGFLLHEIGHKFVAMKYGYRAEFELWPPGLLIALVTAFLGVVFAATGAVKIYADNLTDEMNGKISIAGPMANIAIAIIFIIIAALIYPLKAHSSIFELIYHISTIGFSVNSFLATFNLLPFATLDGTKVLKWSVKIWIVSFTVAAIMTLISIGIGAENMVELIVSMHI